MSYFNVPDAKVLLSKLPAKFDLQINGNGFALLAYIWSSDNKELEVDLSHYRVYSGEEEDEGYIVTRNLVLEIARQFDGQTKVLEIRPDTLFLSFSDRTTKMLPIKLRHNLTFKTQFKMDGDPKLEPDAVKVSGPASMMDTMRFVTTEELAQSEIAVEFSRDVNFSAKLSSRHFSIEPSKVKVTIPVDEFTEGEMMVPLSISNIPEGFTAKTFPDSVKVKYQVGLTRFNQVLPTQFRANVELPDPTEFASRAKLRVTMINQPPIIEIIRIEPERVEYFVRK